VIPDGERAYVLPGEDIRPLRVLDLGTGAITSIGGAQGVGLVEAGMAGELHPDGQSLVGVDAVASTARDLVKWTLSPSPAFAYRERFYAPNEVPCGGLWFDAAGARLFTGCGTVFTDTPATTPHFKPLLKLEGEGRFASLRHLAGSHAIAGVTEPPALPPGGRLPTGDGAQSEVRVYDETSLALQRSAPLPVIAGDGRTFAAAGRFVFPAVDGRSLHVVVRAAAGSGLDWDNGLVTVTP
jgi:hypothetical protein